MFGGKRIDRLRDAQRIREIQDLIRTVAGDVHENGKELEQVKAMMKARAPSVPPKAAPPAPVQIPEPETPRSVPPQYQPVPPKAPPVEQSRPTPQPAAPMPPQRERPVFCIHCGSRLPVDSYGCPVCASRNSRICPHCGTRVNVSAVTCPICRRVMAPVVPYQRH